MVDLKRACVHPPIIRDLSTRTTHRRLHTLPTQRPLSICVWVSYWHRHESAREKGCEFGFYQNDMHAGTHVRQRSRVCVKMGQLGGVCQRKGASWCRVSRFAMRTFPSVYAIPPPHPPSPFFVTSAFPTSASFFPLRQSLAQERARPWPSG